MNKNLCTDSIRFIVGLNKLSIIKCQIYSNESTVDISESTRCPEIHLPKRKLNISRSFCNQIEQFFFQ